MADERMGTAFKLERNAAGEVVMIRGAERTVLGPFDQVCEEMCRFMADEDFGEKA